MQTYFNKLRRQSKQPDARVAHPTPEPPKMAAHPEPPHQEAPKVHEAAQPPPAPKVSTPSEEPAADPVLDEEDESFLQRLAAMVSEPEGPRPPLPTRPMEAVDGSGATKLGRDAQDALMDGADKIPLPSSPVDKGKGKKTSLSYFSLDRFKKAPKDTETAPTPAKPAVTDKDRARFADALRDAVEASKAADLSEVQRENRELTQILDQLNLSAVNNRVFSFTKESEDLLQSFTLVLKDIVNGAPTAYNDLEKLFTDYDAQLKNMYGSLPPFLQNMIKSLPAKLTASLGPELLAAQAEKPGFDGKQRAEGSKTKANKSRIPSLPTIPSLKQLISAQGAVATALRSILNFLRLRFPAMAMGTNLIMSLAVFLLLFVFWYCHKRGREVRLEKERLSAEEAGAAAGSGSSSIIDDDNDSIFGGKKPAQKTIEQDSEQPKDDAEQSSTVNNLPSVSHLPDPNAAKTPEMAKRSEKK